MMSASPPWEDLRYSDAAVEETTRKFFGTLVNTYRFFATYANLDGYAYDEASALALDARSEALVQRALDQLDCSVLVVAHRLATIKACDRIYVLERGLVVEEGNHAELVALNGTYAGMVERQSFED